MSAGVWKESLEELSGEQRSLVALALRLAILLYNPPPFYVLDEIDAGLDVNQISNLGRLLKERLRDVQLICVSEEEGKHVYVHLYLCALLMKSGQ